MQGLQNGLKAFFDKTEALKELFRNLFWTFHPDSEKILNLIDQKLFEKTGHNPLLFFKEVESRKIAEKLADGVFCSLVRKAEDDFHSYMKRRDTWMNRAFPGMRNKTIAYFSAEYGFHKSLPIYSGGLGVLSGDHCCGASDLGLNFIAVGLLYREGYVEQRISPSGAQVAVYPGRDFRNLPLKLITTGKGEPLQVMLDFPGRRVYFQIWEIHVGRVRVYLLDTDVDQNFEQDRGITARLYGGDRDTRISQEIVLGMGGVRALRALNIHPSVWHINEGHSAFLLLELAREVMADKKSGFLSGLKKVKRKIVFTTHTPVKAGNETFSFSLMEKYFKDYAKQTGIEMTDLLEEGVPDKIEDTEEFNMTAFAIKHASFTNGVSRLHRDVSRRMWRVIWPGLPCGKVPIGFVTNGVNIRKWIHPALDGLFRRYVHPCWPDRVDRKGLWRGVRKIPSGVLWESHCRAKAELAAHVKEKYFHFLCRNRVDRSVARRIVRSVSPEHLFIGFGRRFTPYKRAALIFQDEARLKKILDRSPVPVHFIFSGKAHPMDTPGKALLKKIYEYGLSGPFRGRILFLENYTLETARFMVAGCDVWLNTPRRPYEASGTSGQKAGANGVLNFSVLDGWWPEAYNGKNGWAIGRAAEYYDRRRQDREDASSLYRILEKKIIPLFCRCRAGVPEEWVRMMKESMATVIPRFNIIRMVKEYFTRYYYPLMRGK